MERRKYQSISEVASVTETEQGVTIAYKEPFSIPRDRFCMSLGQLRAALPIDCRGPIAREVAGALNEGGALDPAKLPLPLANLAIAFSEYTRSLGAINRFLTNIPDTSENTDELNSESLSLEDLMALETRGRGVGLVLRKLRVSRGLDQPTVARMMGYSRSQISRIENGSRSPSGGYIKRFCSQLGLEELEGIL